ncbi:MAG: hypothetical protein ACREB2_00660, partial [Pseudolabrys sp.]
LPADAVARSEPAASAGKPADAPKRGTAAKTSQTTGVKPRIEIKPKPVHRDNALRPPASIPQSSPGWLR